MTAPRTTKHWSRRTALQSLALGAGGLSTLVQSRRELAHAAGPGAAALATPKRLLLVLSPFGINEGGNWRDWLQPGTTETDFKLAGMTVPLEPHRDQVVFFENLCFATQVNWGDTHFVGKLAPLTSARIVNNDGSPIPLGVEAMPDKCKPASASIDQHFAAKVGRTATPQWPSLLMNLHMPRETWGCYAPDGTGVPFIQSPWEAYQKVFSSIPDGGQVKPDPTLVQRVLQRRSVLDAVAKDVADFRKRLPAEDRARADAQLDAVRTLEQRLSAGAAAPARACGKPTLGSATDVAKDTSKYHVSLRAQTDVALAAMACDLTRVAALGWHAGGLRPLCNFPPMNSNHYDHEMSHDFRDEFVRLKTWYMSEVVYILDRLKAIPEGEGTMLDHTIVFWVTEISMGHQHGRMPLFTAGGKGLGVNTGRCLKLPTTYDGGALYNHKWRRDKGYPHGHLLVSILNALGLPETTFGDAELIKGPMTGYLRG